jgi:hypothetical protein
MRAFFAFLLTIVSVTVSAAPAAGQDASVTRTAASQCAALTSVTLPDVRISSAAAVAAGESLTVPHCKVAGIIGPEIHFELLLPDTWNQRLVMGGGGGFVGRVENQAIASLNAGYATVGTDTGHQADGMDGSWALGQRERQMNYGHLAVHRTAVVAKALVRAYYEAAPRFSYFVGCSNGGRQGLMEAQRHPEDFDGIVSGAPAFNFTNIAAAFVRNAQAIYPNPAALTSPVITLDNLTLVAAKVMETCDTNDAVSDGVVGDPRSCRFTPASLPACPDDRAAPACVTKAQRDAITRVYAPVVSGGATIYPGQPVGGEAERAGWRPWITGPMGPAPAADGPPSLQWVFGSHLFKYFVFADPAWDYSRYDFSTWARDTKDAATFLNADSPDLDAFVARRGKLLLWHGWSDAALNALETIRYHDLVSKRSAAAADAMRLYLLPGVQHCGGGAGPDTVDWIGALASWVEKGQATDALIAKKIDKGAVVRTRPVCVWPQHAVYSGAGSPDEAANFTCRRQ